MMTKNLKDRNSQNQLLLVLMFLWVFSPQYFFADDNLEKDSAQSNIYISEGIILYDTEQNIPEIVHISETGFARPPPLYVF